MQLSELLQEYGIYASMQAFHDGFDAYKQGNVCAEPYDRNSVEGQAWDRGLEAGMRWARREQLAMARISYGEY